MEVCRMPCGRVLSTENGPRDGTGMTRRGRRTAHLFFTATQARRAKDIINDLHRISPSMVPLLGAGKSRADVARALGSAWSVRSVDAVLRRFRAYLKRKVGRRDELCRRIIAS